MTTVRLKDNRSPIRVGKILCLGRNYRAHAEEMKAEVPESPVVFLKPSTALLSSGSTIRIPQCSHDVHYEVELVVMIGKEGKFIPQSKAFDFVQGYGVGLDMTLRDVQAEAKKKGLPWSVAKGFDTSAPVSEFVPAASVHDPHHLTLTLDVNGAARQRGNTADMIFPIDRVIEYLSSVFTMEPGDLIFTGTPEGVGQVHPGDRLHAELQSLTSLDVDVANER
jgi:acylpyruvate hydrolase